MVKNLAKVKTETTKTFDICQKCQLFDGIGQKVTFIFEIFDICLERIFNICLKKQQNGPNLTEHGPNLTNNVKNLTRIYGIFNCRQDFPPFDMCQKYAKIFIFLISQKWV